MPLTVRAEDVGRFGIVSRAIINNVAALQPSSLFPNGGPEVSLRLAIVWAALAACAAVAPARANGFDLIGFLDPSAMNNYTDLWFWSHPSNGKSYVLSGNNASGMHIIDVTDPTNPVQVTVVNTVPRYDIKTRGNLVYSVDGLPNGAGGILDISNPASPQVVGSFVGGHNLWIDSKGFMFVALPGIKCYDLNPNPKAPALVWSVDSQDGHDCWVRGDVLFDFRGYAGTFIYNVTDRYHPQLVGSITDPNIVFHHEGRLSTNGRYLYLCDEFATSPKPDITIWDLANINNIVQVGSINDPNATVHYCYVVGNTLATAYYTAGCKLFDITNPTQPVLIDSYDTSPLSGEGVFEGAYGCYPFGPGGTIYVNDRPNGLFVFRFDYATGVERTPPAAVAILPNTPNPFGASTTIPFRLQRSGDASLVVYDATGTRVRELRSGFHFAGEHAVTWDARDDRGDAVASGVYFARLRIGGAEATRKLVLVR